MSVIYIITRRKTTFFSYSRCERAQDITASKLSMLLNKRTAGLPLICLVCGDVARGINFDLMTCMSCKAFFRRHALKSSVSSRLAWITVLEWCHRFVDVASMSSGESMSDQSADARCLLGVSSAQVSQPRHERPAHTELVAQEEQPIAASTIEGTRATRAASTVGSSRRRSIDADKQRMDSSVEHGSKLRGNRHCATGA